MRNIFVGLLFIFLDFNLTIDQVIIGLIPDFIGYYILRKGLIELSFLGESVRFEKIKPMATFMIYFTSILYIFDLLGFTQSLGIAQRLIGLISLSIYFWILYQIILGIMDMQEKYLLDLNGKRLLKLWKIMALLNVISFILIQFYFIISIAFLNFVATICFLIVLNQTRSIYYTLDNQAP